MKNWESEKFHFFAVAPSIPVCPNLLGARAIFCPPVEAMHAVTTMSRKAMPTISVGTMLIP